MTFVTGDRVKETTTTTGTGTITLAGAVAQFRALSAVAANLDTLHYAIVGRSGTEWEVGLGTWNTGGTLTRVAGDVMSGSAGASTLVSFSAGTKDVFITFPATGTRFADDVILPSLNGGQLAGMRNRIINGDMRIDQRLPGSTVVTTEHFPVDMCTALNNTSTGTITLVQSTLGVAKSVKATATAAVTALTGSLSVKAYQYKAEAQDVHDLNSKTVTLSFTVETNWTGNLSVAIRNSDITFSYIHDAPVVSGTNFITLTLDFESTTIAANDNTVGLSINIGANNEGTLQTATKDAWTSGNFITSTTATQWVKTIGNFVNITEVQLEEGSVATPFERRLFGAELNLCQRYYSKSYDANTAPGTATTNGAMNFFASGFNSSDHTVKLAAKYPSPMRAVPTIVSYDNAGTAGKVTMVGGDGKTATVDKVGLSGFSAAGTNGVVNSQRALVFQYTADARL